jgi:lysophospholipase L1-like esterase
VREAAEESGLRRGATLAEAALVVGWIGIGAACLVLSWPLGALLFAPDARDLSPPVHAFAERIRFGLALLGISGLALSRAAGLAARRLPLTRSSLLLFVLVALSGAAAAEAAFRVRGWLAWGSPIRTPLPMSRMRSADETHLLPGVYAAGVRDDFRASRRRTIFATINRYGMRGRSPLLPRPAGVTRVLCLGGSTTFGHSVTDGEEWPSRLDETLGRDGFEVLNAGRPGATTWSSFHALRDRLLRLEPDVVLLYDGFNDFWRGVRRHGGEQLLYGIVDDDLPPSPQPLELQAVRRWPVRLSFAAHHFGAWLETRVESSASRRPLGLAPGLAYSPRIVAIYERNLAAMIRLCRTAGVRAHVVTFAGSDDPSRPAERPQRLRYALEAAPSLGPEDVERGLEIYRDAARRVAEAESAPLIDAAREMPKDAALFTDTVHFTPEGERQLSAIIARALRALRQPR